MIRKIIQIAVSPPCNPDAVLSDYVYALCDDGSIWWRKAPDDSSWHELPTNEIEEDL